MRSACTVLFCLTWLLAAAFLYYTWQEEQQQHLDEASTLLATTYRASIAKYQLATEILVKQVIERPEVLDTFAAGVLGSGEDRDLARGRLYRLLGHDYVQFSRRGIQQLQFHTTDGYSFLRFEAPDRFGDQTLNIRPSIRLAITRQQPTFSFEAGRLNAGFRYVFPVQRGTQLLGCVEAGIGFLKISEGMAEIDPGREYLLVLRREAVEPILFPERHILYVGSPIDDNYLIEDFRLHLPGSPPPPSEPISRLNARLKANPRVHTGMAAGRAFSVTVTDGDGDWAVSFEPIANLDGAQVAYVIAYARASYLTDLRQEFQINLVFATLALGGLFWLSQRLLRAHATLRQEKQHLQVVTDAIADGLFVMDHDGQIVQVNPAFTEMLGYRADEVLGRIGHNIFHVHGDGTRYAPVTECPIIRATRQGTEYSGEELFKHRDGRLLTVDLCCKPIVDKTYINGSVTAFRDVSARRAAEERLLETARLKSEFLANMSHEFRTPLTIFMAAVEHLQAIDTDPEHRQLLDLADQSSQRLYVLINDILDFSKLEALKMVLDRERFNLRKSLDQVVELMNPKAREKELRLELEVDPAVPDSIEGDQYRLEQVLINLLSNAIKFTDRGGIQVSVHCREHALEFTVSDTGIGIPENRLATIFEVFSQIDGSSTRRHRGTGLGLSISRKLVELMGGSISVSSRVGAGSTFTFTIPLGGRAEDGGIPPEPA